MSNRRSTRASPTEQWDRTVILWETCDLAEEGELGYRTTGAGTTHECSSPSDWGGFGIGRVLRPSPLFGRGDLVFVPWMNGQGVRQPVYGFSSKGRAVYGFYLKYGGRSPSMELLELPDGLRGRRVTDPAVRAFVLGDPP